MELFVLVIDSSPILFSLVEVHGRSALPLLWFNEAELRSYPCLLVSASQIENRMLRSVFNGPVLLFLVLIYHRLLYRLLFVPLSEDWQLNGVFRIIHFILAKRNTSLMFLCGRDPLYVWNYLAGTYLRSFVHCSCSKINEIGVWDQSVLVQSSSWSQRGSYS